MKTKEKQETTMADILKPNYLVKVSFNGSVIGARILDKHYSLDDGWIFELGVQTDSYNFNESYKIADILESIDHNVPLVGNN